jgi:signal transduction histidine kinase
MFPWKGLFLKSILFCCLFSLSFWTVSAVSQQTAQPPSAQIHSRGSIKTLQIAFTEEERSWLAKNHIVRVRIGNVPPFSFLKEEPFGISGDYINAVAQRAGFQLKYLPDIPWPDALKHIKQHEKIDLLPALMETLDREEYIIFTQNYLSSPRVIYTREDSVFVDSLEDLANKTVSVERGYILHQKLSDEYPLIKLLIKENTDEALISLSLGEADAYVGNLTSGTYITKFKGLNNIKIAAPAPFADLTLAMGVRNDWPELASIINKVLVTFSYSDHVAIRNKWMVPIRYEYGISTADVLKLILGISIIALVIILLWSKTLSKNLKNAQDQLVRSEKLVALGKLAGILGHEIKEPLAVIKRSSEFLKIRLGEDVDAKIGKHLNIVYQKLGTIDRIINSVLEFARTKDLKLISVDPNNIVQETLKDITIPAHVTIRPDLASNLPCIKVDEIQIHQAFGNIIRNAIEAMETGGTLIVSTSKQMTKVGHEFVAISFKDTGEGISPEHVDKVFEPLFSTKIKGTGLGLAGCQNVINAHNGSIEISSEVGKGTTFIVKLPVTDSED